MFKFSLGVISLFVFCQLISKTHGHPAGFGDFMGSIKDKVISSMGNMVKSVKSGVAESVKASVGETIDDINKFVQERLVSFTVNEIKRNVGNLIHMVSRGKHEDNREKHPDDSGRYTEGIEQQIRDFEIQAENPEIILDNPME